VGPGVALLWPLSDHALTVAYGWYAAVIVAVGVMALYRQALRSGAD
jgi:hypothetical protein